MNYFHASIGIVLVMIIFYLVSVNKTNSASGSDLNKLLTVCKDDAVKLRQQVADLKHVISVYSDNDEIKTAKIIELGDTINNYKDNFIILRNKLNAAVAVLSDGQVAMYEGRIKELEDSNSAWNERYNEAVANMQEAYQKLSQEESRAEQQLTINQNLQERLQTLTNSQAILMHQVTACEETITKNTELLKTIGQLNIDLQNAQNTTAPLTTQINTMQLQMDDLQQQIDQQTTALASLHDVLDSTTAEKNRYMELYAEANANYVRVGETTASRDYYKGLYEQYLTELQEAQGVMSVQAGEIRRLEAELVNNPDSPEVLDLRNQLGAVQRDLDEARTEHAELWDMMTALNVELSAEKNKNQMLTLQLSTMEQNMAVTSSAILSMSELIRIRFEGDPRIDKLRLLHANLKEEIQQGEIGTCEPIKEKILEMSAHADLFPDENRCDAGYSVRSYLGSVTPLTQSVNADLVYDMTRTACNTTSSPGSFNRGVYQNQLNDLFSSMCSNSAEVQDYTAYAHTLRYKNGFDRIYNNENYYLSQ